MSAALSSPAARAPSTTAAHPWFVAVGVRVWQGFAARALTVVLSLTLAAVVVTIVASVWLQGSGVGTAPSEQTLWLWTWAYSSGRVLTQWALVAPLVLVGLTVASLCATYVQAAPSLAMAKATGPGVARFGWHVRRTDRQGRRTLAQDGYGALLRRRGRWPLLVVGLLASLTVAVTTAVALGGGFADLGLDPGLVPWLTLGGGLVGVVGFASLMFDGVLIAVGPQLQVTAVGEGVDERGFALPAPETVTTEPGPGPVESVAPVAVAPVAPVAVAPPAADPTPQPPAPDVSPKRPAPDSSGDLAGRLERLSALHRAGELDDDEFRAAKASLLTSR